MLLMLRHATADFIDVSRRAIAAADADSRFFASVRSTTRDTIRCAISPRRDC